MSVFNGGADQGPLRLCQIAGEVDVDPPPEPTTKHAERLGGRASLLHVPTKHQSESVQYIVTIYIKSESLISIRSSELRQT